MGKATDSSCGNSTHAKAISRSLHVWLVLICPGISAGPEIKDISSTMVALKSPGDEHQSQSVPMHQILLLHRVALHHGELSLCIETAQRALGKGFESVTIVLRAVNDSKSLDQNLHLRQICLSPNCGISGNTQRRMDWRPTVVLAGQSLERGLDQTALLRLSMTCPSKPLARPVFVQVLEKIHPCAGRYEVQICGLTYTKT
jgi:hypothetical protein